MNLRRHKAKIAAAVAVLALTVLALAAITLLPIHQNLDGPSLTLLCVTNNPSGGKLGTFQLKSLSDEFIVKSFFFVRIDTPNQMLPTALFNPGTTDRFQFGLPPNTGSYKLILLCSPARSNTPQFYHKARLTVVRHISPLFHPTVPTLARWYGYFYLESQPFEVTP
jgi:hypothetical protein